jgi:hypothetical protein
MATLGTQNISTSYNQVLKTYGSNIVGATLAAVASGDEAGVSALQISTTGVKSTGTFAVDGASTFGSSVTISTGTATIGTASINTQTVATSSVNTSTIGTLAVTALATLGSAKIGASGPTITKVSYGTAAFTGSTFQDLDSVTAGSNVTTGTFAVTGAALGDIVFGGLTSIGSSTGTNATLAQRLIPSFRVESTDTIRYVILNTDITSHGTTPAGTLYATAMRFTA